MQQIGVKEGENVDIELINPPEGSYIKIRPHKTEFINLVTARSDYKTRQERDES